MIKKESNPLPLPKPSTLLQPPHEPKDCLGGQELFQLSKNEFLNWARRLPTKHRSLALRIKIPHLISVFRKHTKQFGKNWRLAPARSQEKSAKADRQISTIYQNFTDAIILISDVDYLDCLGFDLAFIEIPQKIYDLLAFSKKIARQILNDQPNDLDPRISEEDSQKFISKLEWVNLVVSEIENYLKGKVNSKERPKIIEGQNLLKDHFQSFWSTLSSQARVDLLFLGASSFDQLFVSLQKMKIPMNKDDLEAETIKITLMEEQNIYSYLCNCQLTRISTNLLDYFELLFKKIKLCLSYRTEKTAKGERRRRRKGKKGKQIDVCSNETNETDIKDTKSDFDLESTSCNKIDKVLTDLADEISDQANLYFESRVVGYERLFHVLSLYGIGLKLYGSCACGIAIGNSDLDTVVDESILLWFNYYPDPYSKIAAAFEMLEGYLGNFKWISSINKIPTAYIPIMKLKVNISVPYELYGDSPQTINYLNRVVQKSSVVQIDLTIGTGLQTTGIKHLGIISTTQIRSWMGDIGCLRSIILILKNSLSKRKLNETYEGGINTYTLIVMVVSFLVDRRLTNSTDLSVVFERVLHFFGWEFDQQKYEIDLRNFNSPGGIFALKGGEERSGAELQVRDPLNDGKVMTRNCYKFYLIKEMMQQTYQCFFAENRKQTDEIYSSSNEKLKGNSTE